MDNKLGRSPRDPADFPRWSFQNLAVEYDSATRSIWMIFKGDGPPCFTLQTLTDLLDCRDSVRLLFASDVIRRFPIDYAVTSSRMAGVYNLGGDLAMFAASIRRGERELLRAYGHACVDAVHGGTIAYGLPIVTVAAISGQALGGGLEAALAHDFLLAEENAMLGVPEVAFNSFPGMGAVTLLTRRLGAAHAERIITGGAVYSGRQMFEMGVVDLLASPGEVERATLAWMAEGGRERTRRRLAIVNARRRCFPVSLRELVSIVDLWADCSCEVTSRDLRYMERLASAQRKLAGAT